MIPLLEQTLSGWGASLRRTTLRLWGWLAVFLLAVPVALWLAWLLGWL